uniref:hypothetical protein n=1 Tax=Cupriavidus gilardii TaxID=82541 RepID=UPI0024790082|nr:hypothetical protein [Cupriavidus gilardii]WDE72555.1 hypothetical protein [Cupriavidus gilardii]
MDPLMPRNITSLMNNPMELFRLQGEARALDALFEALTTPAEIDQKVLEFAQHLGGGKPTFLECQPEPWSRQSCCNMNVAEFIRLNGGHMLCGYRVWYAEPRYIEGERHAVWTDGTTIRDVSFADTGEARIVFIPDERAFDAAPAKVRLAFSEADKRALVAYEQLAALVPISKMPDHQAWATFPTYERWLGGERMPNLIPTVG